MSLSSIGSGGAPKKDSIFSSIAPAPAPMPAAAPAQRPAADAEAVAALKTKMDSLEKNIVALLERKLGEHAKAVQPPAPPPPPPARPPESDALHRKIDDLERRLADFGHVAAISSSQLKNIEESKISARREIEDLLKAVREQQKYSEMDRQMHEQLEKAWARAEEMEKKLMDFYTSVLGMETKRRDEAAITSDKTAAALEALSARLTALTDKISTLATQPAPATDAIEKLSVTLACVENKISALSDQPAAAELRQAQNEFFQKAEEERGAAAAAQEKVSRELLASAKSNEESFKQVFDNYVRREIEILRDRVMAETEGLRREAAVFSDESRKALREQAALSSEKTAEFERLAQANKVKVEGVEAALEAAARRQAAALEEFAARLGTDLRRLNADYATTVKKEGDERFEKFGAKYADALLSVTFVEGFRTALGGAADRLEFSQAQIDAILKGVPPEQLERLLGVSGMLVRKKFEDMGAALETLKDDAKKLRDIKREVEERFKDIFGSR